MPDDGELSHKEFVEVVKHQTSRGLGKVHNLLVYSVYQIGLWTAVNTRQSSVIHIPLLFFGCRAKTLASSSCSVR